MLQIIQKDSQIYLFLPGNANPRFLGGRKNTHSRYDLLNCNWDLPIQNKLGNTPKTLQHSYLKGNNPKAGWIRVGFIVRVNN